LSQESYEIAYKAFLDREKKKFQD